jgi:hypothetical protein
VTTRRFYDWQSSQLEGHFNPSSRKYEPGAAEAEERKYLGAGYKPVKPATLKQDCAGYVVQQLWGVDPVWVTSQNLWSNVIRVFGEKISGPVTWGDAKPKDIVVYGDAGHVAVVVDVRKNLTGNEITIETKDGGERVYRAALKGGLVAGATDPLIRNYGSPAIWRVDTARVRVRPLTDGDCDGGGEGTTWVLQKPEFEIYDPNTKDFVSGNKGSTPTSNWQIGEKGLTFQSKQDGFHLEAVWNQPPPRIRQGDTFVLRIEVTAEGPRKVQASLSPVGPVSEWDIEPQEHAGVTQPGPNALLVTLPNGPDNPRKATATLAAKVTLSGAWGTVNLATGEGSGGRRKVTVNSLFLQVNINNYAKLYWTYVKEGAKPGSF